MNIEEKRLLRNIVADYTENLLISAIDGASQEDLLEQMTDFYNLLVGALTVSKRDGMMAAMTTTLN
jgi:hypothetical protein